MTIVIKNTDDIVYSRFKAKAVEQGLLIGEAITEAMELWLKEKSKRSVRKILQDQNDSFYTRIINDLLEKYEGEGKWGLISNGDLIGIYQSRQECFKAVQTHDLLNTPNLVFPIKKVVSQHRTLGPYRRISNEH